MSFEWDLAKARENLRKHRIPFEVAVEVFRDIHRYEVVDDRFEYGERRWNVIGLADGIEIAVTFTLRGNNTRIISARRAKRHEREGYWNRYLYP